MNIREMMRGREREERRGEREGGRERGGRGATNLM